MPDQRPIELTHRPSLETIVNHIVYCLSEKYTDKQEVVYIDNNRAVIRCTEEQQLFIQQLLNLIMSELTKDVLTSAIEQLLRHKLYKPDAVRLIKAA